MELSKPYVLGGGASRVGVLDEVRVARIVASLEGLSLIPQGSTAYNLDLPMSAGQGLVLASAHVWYRESGPAVLHGLFVAGR
jgi:hypothetical protein